jgi:hypothetical protein
VNLHEDILKEVNKISTNLPLDPRGGSSDPLGPLGPPRYFGLLMVNLRKPPLPPNKLNCQPLNYLEYVKDFDPNAHVTMFKATIKANSEIYDVKIVNLFSLTFKVCPIGVTIIWERLCKLYFCRIVIGFL